MSKRAVLGVALLVAAVLLEVAGLTVEPSRVLAPGDGWAVDPLGHRSIAKFVAMVLGIPTALLGFILLATPDERRYDLDPDCPAGARAEGATRHGVRAVG